jgi:hypothetical protein
MINKSYLIKGSDRNNKINSEFMILWANQPAAWLRTTLIGEEITENLNLRYQQALINQIIKLPARSPLLCHH